MEITGVFNNFVGKTNGNQWTRDYLNLAVARNDEGGLDNRIEIELNSADRISFRFNGYAATSYVQRCIEPSSFDILDTIARSSASKRRAVWMVHEFVSTG
jgi:hypothetical protein